MVVEYIIGLWLFIIGASLGSYAAASAWRLRSNYLRKEKDLDKDEKSELKVLESLTKGKNILKDRSVCLGCEKILNWYELIPIVSFLVQRGKCRKCKKDIGLIDFSSEVFGGLGLMLIFFLWPYGFESVEYVLAFGSLVVCFTLFLVLYTYDLRWKILPNKIVFPLIGVSVFYALCFLIKDFSWMRLINLAGSVGVLAGIYFLLYLMSKGKWVGFGDVKLGIALGFLVADWQNAILALFFANMTGLIVIMPLLLTNNVKRKSKIPFGPFLIFGSLIALLVGSLIWKFLLMNMY